MFRASRKNVSLPGAALDFVNLNMKIITKNYIDIVASEGSEHKITWVILAMYVMVRITVIFVT